MAGLKVSPSSSCILIFLILALSSAASGQARKLMVETPAGAGTCSGGGCLPQVEGSAGLTATTKMATTDGRPTGPGHSPGIGNKVAVNTR
ncbi:hypothetical protein BS78_02G207700 [Paspalum vaginatum]|nr:hypothetical protein BS78_02G207700 [Paspalum vaginatum]